MNDTPSSSSEASLSSPPRNLGWLIALLALAVVALIATIGLWRAQRGKPREVLVEMVGAEAPEETPAIYTAEVIDAITRRDVKAEVGRRYKVVIEDDSKEGNAGIARIGGLVTFVRDAQVGDIVIIEVLRLKKSSAEARIIRRVESARPLEQTSAHAKAPARLKEQASESPVRVGGIYTGVVEDIGRKGDGIVRVGGKVVFINDVQKGQQIVFRVVENNDRFAMGEQVGEGVASVSEEEGSPEKLKTDTADDVIARDGATAAAEEVQVGRVFDVVVVENDKKAPDRNGVARIGGLVVFVPDSQPGERVVIRITERRPRFARSEVLERKSLSNSPR